jgi:hypothetical protein
MKQVDHPVEKWSEKNSGGNDEEKAREECIKTGEQLSTGRAWLVERAHPAENHRRIEERVNPRQSDDSVIAADSDHQRDRDRHDHVSAVSQNPGCESTPRQRFVGVTLVHDKIRSACEPFGFFDTEHRSLRRISLIRNRDRMKC